MIHSSCRPRRVVSAIDLAGPGCTRSDFRELRHVLQGLGNNHAPADHSSKCPYSSCTQFLSSGFRRTRYFRMRRHLVSFDFNGHAGRPSLCLVLLHSEITESVVPRWAARNRARSIRQKHHHPDDQRQAHEDHHARAGPSAAATIPVADCISAAPRKKARLTAESALPVFCGSVSCRVMPNSKGCAEMARPNRMSSTTS